MAFAISGKNLPRVYNYAQAQRVFEDATVGNNFDDGWRGLNGKRDTSKVVRRRGNDYEFRYHNTDLVVWGPERVQFRCWDSVSSVIFANRFTPTGIYAASKRGSMYIVQDDKWYQSNDDLLTFNKKGNDWILDAATAYVHTKYVLDRKRAAQIRKVLAPLREFRDGVLRIRGGNHNAFKHQEGQLCRDIKLLLLGGHIQQEMQSVFMEHVLFYDDNVLLKNAYLVGGAVSKIKVIDQPAEACAYSGRAGLSYLSSMDTLS